MAYDRTTRGVPEGSPVPECGNCSSHVSRDYQRVFADGEVVRGCPACGTSPVTG